MSLATKKTFDAATVVALKMQSDMRRMEITFVDDAGIEQVVSLPVPAALELAKLTLDASAFMTRLKKPVYVHTVGGPQEGEAAKAAAGANG